VFTILPDLTSDEAVMEGEDSDRSCSNYSETSLDAVTYLQTNKLKPFTQCQIKDLVRDFCLTKEASKIPISPLGEHNILDSVTNIFSRKNMKC